MTLFNGQQGQRCKGKAERPLLRSCDFCYTIVGELASILNHRKCNDGRMSPECHSIHSNYLSPSLSFHHFLISRFIFNDFLSRFITLFLTHSHTLHFYSIISVENTREKTFLGKCRNADVTLIGRNGHQIFAFWNKIVFFSEA